MQKISYFDRIGQISTGEVDISYCFGVSLSNDYLQEPHCHYMYEIQCFLSDGWTLRVGKNIYHTEQSSCVFIPSFAVHNMVSAGSGTEKKAGLKFSINAKKNTDNTYRALQIIFSTIKAPVLLKDKRLAAIFELLSECDREDAKARVLFDNLTLSLILLVSDLALHSADKQMAEHTPVLSDLDCLYASQIEQMIMRLYRSPTFSLQAVAENIHLSMRQVERICKKVFSIPFGTLLTRQRMLAAQSLLLAGEKPAAIAIAVGYNSYVAFYRRYKAFFGCNPRAAKSARNGENNHDTERKD